MPTGLSVKYIVFIASCVSLPEGPTITEYHIAFSVMPSLTCVDTLKASTATDAEMMIESTIRIICTFFIAIFFSANLSIFFILLHYIPSAACYIVHINNGIEIFAEAFIVRNRNQCFTHGGANKLLYYLLADSEV